MKLSRVQFSICITTSAVAALFLAACSAPGEETTPGVGGSGSGGAGAGGAAAGTGGAVAGTGGTTAGAGGTTAGTTGSGGAAGSAGTAGGGGSAGSAGSGGSAGSAGSGGSGGSGVGPYGPVSCQPEFETVCKPPIQYTNEEPTQAALIDQLYPNGELEPFLQDILCSVCSVLYRSADEVPSPPNPVKLVVRNISPPAQAGGDQIELDSDHVENQEGKSEELQRIEMRGVLFHEAVHLYQYYGTGGTGEGNADHARIRMGLYEPGRRNSGGSWTDPYTTSGFFFSWLAGPCEYHSDSHDPYDVDLPYKINKRVGEAEDNGDDVQQAVADLLQEIYGSDVNTLWNEYQNAIQ